MIGLLQTFMSPYLEKATKRFFIVLFGIAGIFDLAILRETMIGGNSDDRFATLSWVNYFSQAILFSVLSLLLTGYMLYLSGESDIKNNRIFQINFALSLIYAAMLIVNLFYGEIFTIDTQNLFRRCPLFVLQIPPILIMVLNLLLLMNKWPVLTLRLKRAFSIYCLLPLVLMLMRMRLHNVNLVALSTAITAFFMFSYILADQTEQFHNQMIENNRLKNEILMAQIRPHFIVNSLIAIKQQCRRNPTEAEEAIADFTAYLRYNIERLQSDVPIPFEEELEHVREYLSIQKLRFGDDLNVIYDLKYRNFTLPALTLQPLVENAVTWGVRKSESGTGTVTIRSQAFPDRIEVSVEDNGPGFVCEALSNDREYSHIGIQNVTQRLEQQCGGKLLIDSEQGRGTKVTIILRREEEPC